MTSHRRKGRKRRTLTHKERMCIVDALRRGYDSIAMDILAEEIKQSNVIIETEEKFQKRTIESDLLEDR